MILNCTEFFLVAKTGSSSRTAEKLFKTQPAISQAIRQLETQLNVKLFIHTHTGMELSPQGKRIFGQVKQVLSLLDNFENKFTKSDENQL